MNAFKNKNTRALIFIMCALVLSSIAISHFYYKEINESADPRIVEARMLYERYNSLTQNNDLEAIFSLMDSIETIYTSTDHYKNSFEIGVLYNNRCAAYLTKAMYSNNIDVNIQDSLINLAESSALKSIEIYTTWMDEYDQKDLMEVKNMVTLDFFNGLEGYAEERKNDFLSNRLKEIQTTQQEIPRRLSVSYTNLGIVFRHRLQYEAAAIFYKKAIDLWDRNLTAENNLNLLLGRPEKKRNLIQKLFPPERVQN